MATPGTAADPQRNRFRSLREALDMDPEDVDFAVRGPLLCLYLDRAMTEDSRHYSTGEEFGG